MRLSEDVKAGAVAVLVLFGSCTVLAIILTVRGCYVG